MFLNSPIKKTALLLAPSVVYFLPLTISAFHQSIPGGPCLIGIKGLNEYICLAIHVVMYAVPVAFGAGLLAFFYGVLKFIAHADNDKSRDEGKQVMLWGVIALFVGVSIWGLVSLINTLVGVNSGGLLSPR